MTIWIGVLAGILIGWLIEWIVDWFYWRRGAQAFYTMEHELRQELAKAQQAAADAKAEADALRAQLESTQSDKPHITI